MVPIIETRCIVLKWAKGEDLLVYDFVPFLKSLMEMGACADFRGSSLPVTLKSTFPVVAQIYTRNLCKSGKWATTELLPQPEELISDAVPLVTKPSRIHFNIYHCQWESRNVPKHKTLNVQSLAEIICISKAEAYILSLISSLRQKISVMSFL